MTDSALYKRTLTGFAPFNPKAQRQWEKCKPGDVVELKPVRVRNGGYHKLYFAILKLISDNSDPHITLDEALYLAKVFAGCGRWLKTRWGELFVPGSISFAAMGQADFEAFVKASIPPLVARYMRGTASNDVIREAMEIASNV